MRPLGLEQRDTSICYLDKSDVIISEAVAVEDGHQVVFLDDELENINGALLMQPLVTVPRLPNKVLPEMAERKDY